MNIKQIMNEVLNEGNGYDKLSNVAKELAASGMKIVMDSSHGSKSIMRIFLGAQSVGTVSEAGNISIKPAYRELYHSKVKGVVSKHYGNHPIKEMGMTAGSSISHPSGPVSRKSFKLVQKKI